MPEISSSSFSETDASNNSASPNGFPENMAFSGVNDSARAVMGALKRFWGRVQGAYASTGSANAYVLTPSAALAAYVAGERYSFRSNFANTAAATLNISALGAKAIKKMTASGKADLASGDIQNAQPVTVEYDGTDLVMTTPHAQTGKVLQVVSTQTGAVATGTMVMPVDDTIPQNTEGDEYMAIAVTPRNVNSTLLIDVVIHLASSAVSRMTVALFQDSVTDALAVGGVDTINNANDIVSIGFRHKMTAGATSATIFKVRAGATIAGTTTLNGHSGARLFGGRYASSITISEIAP